MAHMLIALGANPSQRSSGYTERTRAMVSIGDAIAKQMKTHVEYPHRPLQSLSYTGPTLLSDYFRFQNVRDQLSNEGIGRTLPTGN
jgi:hypothetical protein